MSPEEYYPKCTVHGHTKKKAPETNISGAFFKMVTRSQTESAQFLDFILITDIMFSYLQGVYDPI